MVFSLSFLRLIIDLDTEARITLESLINTQLEKALDRIKEEDADMERGSKG